MVVHAAMQHKAAMKIQAGGGLRNIITSLVCFDTIKLIIRFPFQGFQNSSYVGGRSFFIIHCD